MPEIRDLIMYQRGMDGNMVTIRGLDSLDTPLFPQRSARHMIHFTTSHTITDANDRK